jgi:hypothetical protein
MTPAEDGRSKLIPLVLDGLVLKVADNVVYSLVVYCVSHRRE